MKKCLLLLLIIPLLTGCVQQQVIDKLNIETAQGYDLAENDQLRGTLLFVKYLPDKSVQNRTLTATAKTSRDVLTNLERRSSDPLVTGGVGVVLFGEELAKHGFVKLVDSLQRDPNIGTRLFIAITEGNAEDILTGNYGFEGNSTFIRDLLIHNMKNGDIPKVNLHVFGSYYAQKGRDAYLPIIQKVNDTDLDITGMAVFKKNRIVKKVDADHLFHFKLLVDKYSEGTKTVTAGKYNAVVHSIRSKNKIKIKKHPLEATVYLKLNAIVREYSGTKVTTKVVKNLEKGMEKEVKKECLKMLKDFQKEGMDPVGFGLRVKNKTRNFSYSKWRDEYKTMKIKVVPKVTIMESGTVQ
ncbi:Ger(x)C family spore germination protein [Heyndrickxia vini]|uniref:Ger(X)C family spore germination protein n=1 Tax=Heyndrickxia vini TaxID=1476025 RepID=A0ABX7E580_9BACI|nr:Ger(x)C family spore germination protein [Heyndrickxia vini]QQZ10460.1 Ger(x)C family spore germination protein [Heyndrickxia vini]